VIRSGIFTSLFCVVLVPRGAHSFIPTQEYTRIVEFEGAPNEISVYPRALEV